MKKTTTRIMSLLLSVMLLISAFSGFAAVSAADESEQSAYSEAIDVLKALSVMVGDAQTGLIRPNDPIKRSEVAKMAIAILGLTDIAHGASYKSKYSDVGTDHWAVGYINVATDQGIVIGDAAGTFRPDDTITYEEAMTIIVRVIGFEPFAKDRGGYPAGYLVAAAENKLNKNAYASNSSAPATRGIVGQIFFNALEVKMMEQTGFGEDADFVIGEKTLLKDKLNAKKISGQVTATHHSSLSGTSALDKDEVKIGSEIYSLAEGIDVTTLLGYNVNAYLQEDTYGDDYVIMVAPAESKNSSLEISAENFEALTDSKLEYWKDKDTDKKTTIATLEEKPTLIYNGQAESYKAETVTMTNKAGKIKLLDTDRNGKYDIIFVTEYKNIVVEDVMPTSGKIIDKYGAPTIVLDPEDEDLDFIIEKAGESIKVSDLKKWDVLSIAESRDKTIYRIHVINDVVEGKVKEISGDYEVSINGKLYKIAANYPYDIDLSDEGKFYLDIEGKIAAVDATSGISSNYAFLINAAMSGAIDDTLQLKLFTKDGQTVTLHGADKIRFNGKSGYKPTEALELLKKDGKVVNQLITFEKNSDGKIVSIVTATDNTQSGAINEDGFTHNLTLKDAIYKSATGKLGSVNISDKTVIFDIPADWKDASDLSVRTHSMFENDTPYDALVFDMSKDYTAGALIVTSTDYQANAASSAAIVTNIVASSNDDDVVVDKVYLSQDGESKVLFTTELGALVKEDGKTPLQPGDIIQYSTNANGEITTYRILFDISKKTTEFATDITDDLSVVYGKVSGKFSGSMNVTVNGASEQNISFGSAKIYLVDTSKSTNKIVSSATTGDIQKFDDADPHMVFVKSYKGVAEEIIIIRL